MSLFSLPLDLLGYLVSVLPYSLLSTLSRVNNKLYALAVEKGGLVRVKQRLTVKGDFDVDYHIGCCNTFISSTDSHAVLRPTSRGRAYPQAYPLEDLTLTPLEIKDERGLEDIGYSEEDISRILNTFDRNLASRLSRNCKGCRITGEGIVVDTHLIIDRVDTGYTISDCRHPWYLVAEKQENKTFSHVEVGVLYVGGEQGSRQIRYYEISNNNSNYRCYDFCLPLLYFSSSYQDSTEGDYHPGRDRVYCLTQGRIVLLFECCDSNISLLGNNKGSGFLVQEDDKAEIVTIRRE